MQMGLFKETQKLTLPYFFYISNGIIILVLIYDDDINLIGNNNANLNKFIEKLEKLFTLKDLGALHFFLGIEVARKEACLYLTQTKYIEDLLENKNMQHLKPFPTLIATDKSLSLTDGKLIKNPTKYKSLIGALQYLNHTRPDISYAVNTLSQFFKCPTTSHWNTVKRILRYLQGTSTQGLHLSCYDKLNLVGFSDANWASNVDDRRSVCSYCVYHGESLVSWSSKKQAVVSRSSIKTEYRALARVSAEITWLESLLNEIKFHLPALPITWCDNMSASVLALNLDYHGRTKHIEIDIHFVRDKVLNKALEVKFIPSADCMTKTLSHSRFHYLIAKLGVKNSPPSLRSGVKKND
ncbi:hypothetical protein CsatB_019796 [Cannabis sativa]